MFCLAVMWVNQMVANGPQVKEHHMDSMTVFLHGTVKSLTWSKTRRQSAESRSSREFCRDPCVSDVGLARRVPGLGVVEVVDQFRGNGVKRAMEAR